MLRETPLKEIMKQPVVTAKVDDPFSKVEEKFCGKGIRHIPVVDENGAIVGLITQRDLFRIATPRVTEAGYYYDPATLDNFILKHVMKKDPVTLSPRDHLAKAVEIMARQKYGCIPIVDSAKKVVGIVTETDVLKFVARNL